MAWTMHEYRELARTLYKVHFDNTEYDYESPNEAFENFLYEIQHLYYHPEDIESIYYAPSESESAEHVKELVFDDGVMGEYEDVFGCRPNLNINWRFVDNCMLHLACHQIKDEIISYIDENIACNDYSDSIERIEHLISEIWEEYQKIDRGGYFTFFFNGRTGNFNNNHWDLPENKKIEKWIKFTNGKGVIS